MTKIERALEICDHCLAMHQLYIKGDNFNYTQKVAVSHCTGCGNAMCSACHVNSLNEIKGSILATFGFSLCRQCIVDYWRTTDTQEEMEQFIKNEVELVKKKMKKHIYLHNHRKQ